MQTYSIAIQIPIPHRHPALKMRDPENQNYHNDRFYIFVTGFLNKSGMTNRNKVSNSL